MKVFTRYPIIRMCNTLWIFDHSILLHVVNFKNSTVYFFLLDSQFNTFVKIDKNNYCF